MHVTGNIQATFGWPLPQTLTAHAPAPPPSWLVGSGWQPAFPALAVALSMAPKKKLSTAVNSKDIIKAGEALQEKANSAVVMEVLEHLQQKPEIAHQAWPLVEQLTVSVPQAATCTMQLSVPTLFLLQG